MVIVKKIKLNYKNKIYFNQLKNLKYNNKNKNKLYKIRMILI
jgi:hypothetical protein